jgi:type 1 glutamine amidotransferase
MSSYLRLSLLSLFVGFTSHVCTAAGTTELAPAPIDRPGEPPPRSRAEVQALLKDAKPVDAAQLKPLEIVLVAGPKDHGPSEHDYPQWQQRWTKLLGLSPRVHVTTAELWPSPEQWRTADGVVIFSANQGWSPERARDLDAFYARGGGLVLLHWAVNGLRAPEELAARVGLAWKGPGSKYRHGPLDLQFPGDVKHPITVGFTQARFIDESYWNLLGDEQKIKILATQTEDGAPRPLLWTYEPGRGRVFVSILGHYNWTFDDPLYRLLVLRGMAWTMQQPIDRFNGLLFTGARVSEP